MRFPTHEADTIRLTLDVAKGLEDHKDVFPTPPTSPDDLRKAAADFTAAHDQAVADAAKSSASIAIKDQKLEAMATLTKGELRYAEGIAHGDATKLGYINWGPHRAAVPAPLTVPGQVSTLQVASEGVNQVSLVWQEPLDGGAVAAYRVERRKRPDGIWAVVGMAVDTKITLTGQDGGVEWEYRVIAVNKTGEGPESNVARAVL